MNPKSLRTLTREARQRTRDRSIRVQLQGAAARVMRHGQPATGWQDLESIKAILEALPCSQ